MLNKNNPCNNITNLLYYKRKDLTFLKQAQKELRNVPKDVNKNLLDLFDELMEGHKLSMPVSKPLFSIAVGLHELRLSGQAGEFRVFYLIMAENTIYVIHAASKKKQEMDKKTRKILETRIRSLGI